MTKRDKARVRTALWRLPFVFAKTLLQKEAELVIKRLHAVGAELKLEDESADK
jgi:hypothetical protein